MPEKKTALLGLLLVLGLLAGISVGEDMPRATTILIEMEGKQIKAVLYDTPAAQALAGMLPLTLDFGDYASTEKISYLPESLSTQGVEMGHKPSAGDITLYAPWGNLAIFYQDAAYSDGLVSLGRIEEGMEALTSQASDFTALLRAAE